MGFLLLWYYRVWQWLEGPNRPHSHVYKLGLAAGQELSGAVACGHASPLCGPLRVAVGSGSPMGGPRLFGE